MRIRAWLIAAAAASTLLFGITVAAQVADRDLGLSGSVFETPDPLVAATSAGDPGDNRKLGSYFEGMPPMISHRIEDLLPITLKENLCLDCHDLPAEIGTESAADEPTPMPRSHYLDLRRPGAQPTEKPTGARYTCTQCHAPQTDAQPLVASTYRR